MIRFTIINHCSFPKAMTVSNTMSPWAGERCTSLLAAAGIYLLKSCKL
jgi:hypothetical protein